MINMQEYMYYATGVAIVSAGLYGIYKKYLKDGKLTLDEVMDIVEDVEDIVDDLTNAYPSLAELKKMKKAELVALCEKYDIDAKGVKAELVSRLSELK
jgi:hypothetical protein